MSEKIKNRTRQLLIDLYSKKGKGFFLEVAEYMLSERGTSPTIRGELCEVVLEVLLMDYIKTHPDMCSTWIITKGMILMDLDNKTDYKTELDLVLSTPKRLYVFECKSYSGKKTLTDKGTLNTMKGNKISHSFDVYSQHEKHYALLFRTLSPFLLDNVKIDKPYQILLFTFDSGSIQDLRTKEYRSLFSWKTKDNLYKLFNTYKELPDQWDMPYVKEALDKIVKNQKKLTKHHRDYVTNLHH